MKFCLKPSGNQKNIKRIFSNLMTLEIKCEKFKMKFEISLNRKLKNSQKVSR